MSDTVRPSLDLSRDLGGGLRVRRATPADVEPLADLISRVFAPPKTERYVPLPHYIRDLASGRHPTVRVDDFLLVEDAAAGRPVSALVVIPQAWEYDGLRCDVGRIEVVVTEKDYRRRGLVRALFDAAHALSAAYGHLAQGVTGIYYFYRQFGYEYALDLGGSRAAPFALVPELKAGEAEEYTLRPAVEDDLPQIRRLYDRQRAGKLVSTPRDEAYTRWIMFDQSPDSSDRYLAYMIVDAAGRSVGSLSTLAHLEDPVVPVFELGVEPDVSLRAVMPGVLRGLKAIGAGLRTHEAEPAPPDVIRFELGRAHAVYDAAPDFLRLARPPYAWYVRVPDLPRFLWHIAPVLERRLAGSVVAGFTGELHLNFYRSGIGLRFDAGRLVECGPWSDPDNFDETTHAAFPPLVFLQLLFGRRSFDELRYVLPDVMCKESYQPLLKTLFPAQASWVTYLP